MSDGHRRSPSPPDVGVDEQRPFLSRWSRRKRSQQLSAEAPAVPAEAIRHDEEKPAAPVLTDADMPAIEHLGEDSDYGGFLSPEVSDKLRTAALRKLFHLSAFNVRDGLDDYDDDFTTFEPLGATVTADMRHQMELAEQRRKAAEATERDDDQLARAESDSAPDDAVPTAEEYVPSDDHGGATDT